MKELKIDNISREWSTKFAPILLYYYPNASFSISTGQVKDLSRTRSRTGTADSLPPTSNCGT